MTELDFEELFERIMTIMKVMQCHPGMTLNKYWMFKTMVKLGPYLVAVYTLNYSFRYYLREKDYANAFKCGVPIVYQAWMIFNFITLLKNRSLLLKLIKAMKDDYLKISTMDINLKQIMQKQANEGRRIMRFWWLLMLSTIGMFAVKCLVLTIYYAIQNRQIKIYYFFEMYYPWKLTERRENEVLIFILTFLFEVYFTTVSVLMFFCTFPIGMVFILHACSQLELIAIKFENIFEEDDVDERLNEIVQNLQYTYGLVQQIFSKSVIMKFLIIHS